MSIYGIIYSPDEESVSNWTYLHKRVSPLPSPEWSPCYTGALVPQRVKRWPTDLAVLRLSLVLTHEKGSIAHSLSLSSLPRPDMTEILLKKDVKLLVNQPTQLYQ